MLDLSMLRGITVRQRTASFVCFELPDRKHIVEVYYYQNFVLCYVREDHTSRETIRFPIDKKRAGNWEDLVQGFCEKAYLHFPKGLESRGRTIRRY